LINKRTLVKIIQDQKYLEKLLLVVNAIVNQTTKILIKIRTNYKCVKPIIQMENHFL